jgi:hypothetical protein
MLFMGRNPLTIAQEGPGNSPSELENSAAIHFWLKNAPQGDVRIEITDLAGEQRFDATVPARQGVNRYMWNLRFNPPPRTASGGGRGGGPGGFGQPRGAEAGAGTYIVRLTVNGQTVRGTVAVRDDPGLADLSEARDRP